MFKSKIAYLSLSILVLSSTPVLADGVEDYYHQFAQRQYFNQPQNARTFGMAGSSVATSSDSSSAIGNPAGMGWMEDAEISGSYGYDQLTGNDAVDYSDLDSEFHSGHIAAALPLGPTLDGLPDYGNLGLAWTGSSGDGDDSLAMDTDKQTLQASYAKALNDKWSLGYGVGVQWEEIRGDSFEVSADGSVRQTVGAQYKASENTTWGASTFYGFGEWDVETGTSLPVLSSIQDEDYSSWGADVGVATKVAPSTLLAFSTDYVLYSAPVSEDLDSYSWNFRTGIEQNINDTFDVRAGYRYIGNFDFDVPGQPEDQNAKANAVSLGAGAKLGKHFKVDYAAEYRAIGDGDWSHLVTASVPFSLCKEDYQ